MQGSRVPRTAQDLTQALRDQVELLQLACDNFDAGRVVAARNMATQLRVLLHEPTRKGSRSVPLLRQVKFPSRFLNLAFPIDPRVLTILKGAAEPRGSDVPVCGLVNVKMNSSGASFFAPLDDVSDRSRAWKAFPDWWMAPVVRDYKGRVFTRHDLVIAIADTDGGAHVDSGLPPSYAELKEGIGLGWAVRAEGRLSYVRDLELHCLRQISHEFLSTLRRYLPWSLKTPMPHPLKASSAPGHYVIGELIALADGASFIFENSSLEIVGDTSLP